MPKLDQFESVFKAATKEVFELKTIKVEVGLIITDLNISDAEIFGKKVRSFLSVPEISRAIDWRLISGDQFHGIGELLELVQNNNPDLICSYRHLHSDGWKWPYSLGEELDVLTQETESPVLVFPNPKSNRESDRPIKNTSSVMAITDHLTGDHRLVNYSTTFTQPEGTLYLTHIEDQEEFDRLKSIISKIPSIDTDTAIEEILNQKLKEPRDYIRSCREVLEASDIRIDVETIIEMGNHLPEYRKLIEKHNVDLLIFNTKDKDQLAMHGMAYPLAVELRQLPLLML